MHEDEEGAKAHRGDDGQTDAAREDGLAVTSYELAGRARDARTTPSRATQMPSACSGVGSSPRAMPYTTGSAAPVAEMGATILTRPTAMPRYSAAIPVRPVTLAAMAYATDGPSIVGGPRNAASTSSMPKPTACEISMTVPVGQTAREQSAHEVGDAPRHRRRER